MKKIWILLIWLMVVAISNFVYSILIYYLSGDDCEPTHISLELDSAFKNLDRFLGYQSWFIPLIWIWWPTKARKRENISRYRAAKTLADSMTHFSEDL